MMVRGRWNGSMRGCAKALRYAVLLATAAPAILLSGPVAAQRATDERRFEIAAQPLAQALMIFGRQAGLQVTAAGTLTDGRTSTNVKGTMSSAGALSQLLAGTGLTFRFVSGGVQIEAAPQIVGDAIQLGPVRVEGAAGTARAGAGGAIDEVADGPAPGIVARRTMAGTKTDTPIVEVPQSISVVTADQVEIMAAQSLAGALAYIAGVNFTDRPHGTIDEFVLRGFQAQAGTGSTYRDGLRFAVNVYNGQQEPYGLERIEVLKGAASLLYGAAEPGGIINTVSKLPGTEPVREIALSVGSFRRRQANIDFSGPVAADGDVQARLTAVVRDSDTFVDHSRDDRIYIAPSIKWQVGNATDVTLFGFWQRDRGTLYDGLPYVGSVVPASRGGIARDWYLGEPRLDRNNVEQYQLGYRFEHVFSPNLRLRHSLNYFDVDVDMPYTSGAWPYVPGADGRTVARELNDRRDAGSSLAGDISLQYDSVALGAQHKIVVGVDYSGRRHETERYTRSLTTLDIYEPVYGAVPGERVRNDFSWNSVYHNYSLYAQDQIKIADRLVILVGARQERIRNREELFFTPETFQIVRHQPFTWRAGAVYLAPNGLAPFFGYSRSFSAQEGRTRTGGTFDPTTGEQYEAGIRYQPDGAAVMLSAAVYQLTKRNILTPDPVDRNFSIQTGAARSRGVELEAKAQLATGLDVIAAYAFTDAKVTKSNTGTEVGTPLQGVARHNASLWTSYRIDDPRLGGGLTLGGGVRHVGRRIVSWSDNPVTPAYTVFNAVVRYDAAPWRISLNVDNLFDRRYVAACSHACFYGEPRRLILTAAHKW